MSTANPMMLELIKFKLNFTKQKKILRKTHPLPAKKLKKLGTDFSLNKYTVILSGQ